MNTTAMRGNDTSGLAHRTAARRTTIGMLAAVTARSHSGRYVHAGIRQSTAAGYSRYAGGMTRSDYRR